MTKVIDHASRYPGARASTLVHLLQREKTTARLTEEVSEHVGAVLVADLEEKLSDREQVERIREAF